MRDKVVMACTKCKQRNYNTSKNKNHNSERLELKKYCKFCKEHTLHKETR
ncbi:50S ribosomal protein L33 [Anaerosalibacter massiliensis]|uniref:Large ribosomal subunit protein bL33 n=1 Tax=Anaerosalibacter massiliensis TaxID=1347392 RepID=A0A9X2MLE2_9FIRM|nr:50S ribosomal protein L33 [Anaerosalibacter massiliensis]MCR2045626.1 50S ribosomal protein L33 [Anaerosalibacter massiliensis]